MRLDNYLVEKCFFDSRTKAKQAILRGEIFIDNDCIQKPSFDMCNDITYKVERVCEDSFVSLGGFKLKKALTDFNFIVNGLTVADIGASTGGFTDCLLQNGAKTVFAVDLNDDLLHQSLKDDKRVKRVIKNARELKKSDFSLPIDLIVADLSFISITYVLNVFSNILDNDKYLLVLIKPQFEANKKRKLKNGIVKDKKEMIDACRSVLNKAIEYNFAPIAFTNAPLVDGKNVEFLMLFQKNGVQKLTENDLRF
ncbi:MAG: TlyA family RNA methyltransferase [Clostridiales bacterium]|nr:TlyA family RNA methyltransferase [Clostridiales bacterium]